MSLKDDLLPIIDDLRGLPGEFGLHPFQVFVRVVTWSGQRAGLGAKTVTETQLLVGGQNPKVRAVKSADIVAGTSELQDTQYDIGPLTPSFIGGGISNDTINPQNAGVPTELTFLLKGPGLPTAGLLCERVNDLTDYTMHTTVRVRSTGRRRPNA